MTHLSAERRASPLMEVAFSTLVNISLPVQLTDVKLISQQLSATGGTVKPSEQLTALARLCFTRVLGACWIIPCMDLIVRVKLNIIGR